MIKEKLFKKPIFRIAGDKGFIIEFGNEIDPVINARVRIITKLLNNDRPLGILEIIPTYRSILIIYDSLVTCPDKLKNLIEDMTDKLENIDDDAGRIVNIPVCYNKEFGCDLEKVKKWTGLSSEDIIRIHSEPEYLIYMIGFTPGFPFLGGLDERLFTPRHKTPRMLVPEGSVGIANNQTGIYPIASPGGWQIIGRTPMKLFAPQRETPFLYKAGDRIKFVPISDTEYQKIKQEEENQCML